MSHFGRNFKNPHLCLSVKTGEHIPLAARIFAVVDVYDALTSDRPYRTAWSKEQTLEYMKSQSGQYSDPLILQTFIGMSSDL